MAGLILILEDNPERRQGFEAVLGELVPECEIRVWSNARTMVGALEDCLPQARLISLDHDLNEVAAELDAGDGLIVAEYLSRKTPVCPVVVHSSNYERSLSMVNEMTYAGWGVERVGPVCPDWISTLWQPMVSRLLGIKAAL